MKEMYGVIAEAPSWQEPEQIMAFETVTELADYMIKAEMINEHLLYEDSEDDDNLKELGDKYGNNWQEEVKKWDWKQFCYQVNGQEIYKILCP